MWHELTSDKKSHFLSIEFYEKSDQNDLFLLKVLPLRRMCMHGNELVLSEMNERFS